MPNIYDIIDPRLINDDPSTGDPGGGDIHYSGGININRVQVGDDLYEVGDYIVNGEGEILGEK